MSGFRNFYNDRERERAAAKGSKRAWGSDTFELAVTESAKMRFLAFQESTGQPYTRTFHWPAGMGQKTCTSYMEEFGGKCVYCYYDQKFVEEQKIAKAIATKNNDKSFKSTSSRLKKQTQVVFEVVDFRFYHVTPVVKDDAKEMRVCNVDGPDADETRCEMCADSDATIAARVFGGGRRWEVKNAQVPQIFDAFAQLQKLCVFAMPDGSACGKETYTVDLLCSNPECAVELLPSSKVTMMNSKTLSEFLNKPVKCAACGTEDYPRQESACKSKAHAGVRASLQDKNLLVSCSGTKEKTFDGTEYEKKTFSFDIKSEPFESIEDSLLAWGFEEAEITKICAPQNLDWKFAPERISRKKYSDDDTAGYVQSVLAEQADSLKKDNPYGEPAKKEQTQRTFTRRS